MQTKKKKKDKTKKQNMGSQISFLNRETPKDKVENYLCKKAVQEYNEHYQSLRLFEYEDHLDMNIIQWYKGNQYKPLIEHLKKVFAKHQNILDFDNIQFHDMKKNTLTFSTFFIEIPFFKN